MEQLLNWTADTWIALLLIVAYFIFLIGIGVGVAKKIKNTEDYIFAVKKP